jgi:hypothetical protein
VFTKLLGLNYIIVYKKGSENSVDDALSRRPDSSQSCYVVSFTKPKWLDLVVKRYDNDSSTKELITKLTLDDQVVPNFTWAGGLLRYKSRIWVGAYSELQLKLIYAMHKGHRSGAPVTYRRIKQMFAWKDMKEGIHEFVQSCLICQQAKPDRSKTPRLLQPLSVSDAAWQIISLDFVEGLPQSDSANCVLVVVDELTKYAHFLKLRHPYTVVTVAKLFLDQIYRLHGMPQSIISNRDKIFTSLFWKELFHLSQVQLRMSSVYHP